MCVFLQLQGVCFVCIWPPPLSGCSFRVHMAPPCTRRLLFATWSGQFAADPRPLDQARPNLGPPRPLLPAAVPAAAAAAPAPGRGPRHWRRPRP